MNESELFNRLNVEWFERHKETIAKNDDEFIGHTALHFFKKGREQLESEKAALEHSLEQYKGAGIALLESNKKLKIAVAALRKYSEDNHGPSVADEALARIEHGEK